MELSYLCVLCVFASWRDALSSRPIEYHAMPPARGENGGRDVRPTEESASLRSAARGDFKTLSHAPVIRAKSLQKTYAVQAPRLRARLMFIFVPWRLSAKCLSHAPQLCALRVLRASSLSISAMVIPHTLRHSRSARVSTRRGTQDATIGPSLRYSSSFSGCVIWSKALAGTDTVPHCWLRGLTWGR